jgi:hypothetical protein
MRLKAYVVMAAGALLGSLSTEPAHGQMCNVPDVHWDEFSPNFFNWGNTFGNNLGIGKTSRCETEVKPGEEDDHIAVCRPDPKRCYRGMPCLEYDSSKYCGGTIETHVPRNFDFKDGGVIVQRRNFGWVLRCLFAYMCVEGGVLLPL